MSVSLCVCLFPNSSKMKTLMSSNLRNYCPWVVDGFRLKNIQIWKLSILPSPNLYSSYPLCLPRIVRECIWMERGSNKVHSRDFHNLILIIASLIIKKDINIYFPVIRISQVYSFSVSCFHTWIEKKDQINGS